MSSVCLFVVSRCWSDEYSSTSSNVVCLSVCRYKSSSTSSTVVCLSVCCYTSFEWQIFVYVVYCRVSICLLLDVVWVTNLRLCSLMSSVCLLLDVVQVTNLRRRRLMLHVASVERSCVIVRCVRLLLKWTRMLVHQFCSFILSWIIPVIINKYNHNSYLWTRTLRYRVIIGCVFCMMWFLNEVLLSHSFTCYWLHCLLCVRFHTHVLTRGGLPSWLVQPSTAVYTLYSEKTSSFVFLKKKPIWLIFWAK